MGRTAKYKSDVIAIVERMSWCYTQREIAECVGCSRSEVQRLQNLYGFEKMQPRPRWSEDDVKRLTELHAAGRTHRQVGRELGRTKAAVALKLQELRNINQ